MAKRERLTSGISLTLVAAMIIGMVSALAGMGYVEPDNPLSGGPELLVPEILTGTGSLNGSGEGVVEQTLPPEESQPEETEPPTEPPETEPPTEPPTQPPETEPEEETQPPTQPEEPSDPVEGPDEDVGSDLPGNDDGGGSDSGESGDGTAGGDGDGPGEGGSLPGEGDDDSVRIVTDLESRLITRLENPEGILKFYAYPSVDEERWSVKVVVNNSATSLNGEVLTSGDGIHYEAPMVLNDTTIVTLFLKENGENVSYVRYEIRYEAEKADENNPEVGDHPPTIVTNLDDFTGVMETQDFLFWVSAHTNPEGEPIYSNQIQVWLNGQPVPKQTGDARPEYELHFEPPNVGDTAEYTVKVLAWDGRGNSTMKVYTVNYHTVSEGDYLGTVTLVLDATTVGLGIIDSAVYEIVQGDTAAGVVIKFLEDYGYDAVYDGSATVGFYLRRLYRGDMCYGAQVPERLWELILRDGIQLSNPAGRDGLGEYDYTMGSGWMYSINGSIYPGRGLSEYMLSSNTTIYLRFTLAYGKDIGGSGQGYGSLSDYCGVWINGGYTPRNHDFEETERLEPAETEDGYILYTCTKCGETKEEILPMTGEPTEPEETDPEETNPEETNPEETDPEETNPEETDPEETDPEETDPEETDPEETNPEETNPEETNPEETEPEETEPAPTEPAPTEPAPTEPAPTEPAPTEPAPTEPAPTEPAPTEPAPTEPAPTEPAPTEPAPTEPAPTEPAPTEPAPTEPAPTEPAPTEPAPTEPAPTDPAAANQEED